MSPSVPFNPLDKRNLAESVALAALDHDARPLTLANTEDVAGEGVYLISVRETTRFFGTKLPARTWWARAQRPLPETVASG